MRRLFVAQWASGARGNEMRTALAALGRAAVAEVHQLL